MFNWFETVIHFCNVILQPREKKKPHASVVLNSIATMYNQTLKTIVAITGSATAVVVAIYLIPMGIMES